MKIASTEQADSFSSRCNGILKRLKNRKERRRAKQDPDCQPGYGKYKGYAL